MNFFYYDLAFLALFIAIIAIFLYRHRKKVQVESKVFLLYRTKVGIKIIEKLSKILPLNVLSYIAIFSGYAMMIFSLYLFYKLLGMMIVNIGVPNIPPIMPLIPYMPAIFKIEFLPPFYFTYWIITILIIAVSHEFSHGIFARFNKIKLKSTGFGFLGPFLAAFVELDEKSMAKKSNKAQLAILSGGPFANLVIMLLFLIIMNAFSSIAYVPAGVNYIYSVNNISISSIEKINNISLYANSSALDILEKTLAEKENQTNNTNPSATIIANGTKYFMNAELMQMQKSILDQYKLNKTNISDTIFVYYDSPAYNAQINGSIIRIDSQKITSINEFNKTISNYLPNQKINLETTVGNYTITLAAHPDNSSKPFLGIAFLQYKESWLVKYIRIFVNKKDPFTYYQPKAQGQFGSDITIFVYNLLFWIVVINFSVALFNMVPLSVFDGGKFFYITMLMLTKSKDKAKKAFSIMSAIIFLFFIFITALWFFRAI